MASENPEWLAGDPQNNLEEYWEAWYKIGNAPAVMVNGYCRTGEAALTLADKSLNEALAKVLDLKLQIDGECWIVRWQTRKQTRKWPKSNIKGLSVGPWRGSIAIVLTSLIKKTERSRADH